MSTALYRYISLLKIVSFGGKPGNWKPMIKSSYHPDRKWYSLRRLEMILIILILSTKQRIRKNMALNNSVITLIIYSFNKYYIFTMADLNVGKRDIKIRKSF